MKTKLLWLVIIASLSIILARPLVAVSYDDYGFAISTRTSIQERFEPLWVWRR